MRPTWSIGHGLLAYCDLIKNAAEGHYINSALWWYAEHGETTGELYAHWYARPFLPIWQEYAHRKAWKFYK